MVVVALALLAAPAEPLAVEWTAPEGCPGADDVKAAVARTLGESAEEDRAKIRAVGRVASSSAGFVLQLEVHDGNATSQRELTGATCEEVTSAAAFILAMAIDPRVALTEEPESTETETETQPEAEAKTVVPEVETRTEPTPKSSSIAVAPRSPTPPPPRRRLPIAAHFLGRAMAGLGLGPLPAPSASIALALGLGGRLWRVEAVGHFWPAVEGDAPNDPSRRARARLWSVGARGCVVPETRSFMFPICTGVDAGMMRAQAVNVDMPREASTPWAAIVLGPGAEWWPIRYVGLGVRVDGHAAVFRPKFVTDPSGTVHQAAPVGLQVLGGLLVRAP